MGQRFWNSDSTSGEPVKSMVETCTSTWACSFSANINEIHWRNA